MDYGHPPIEKYLTYLRENNLLLELNNVKIDLLNIAYRKFKCNPNRCLQIVNEREEISYTGSCCTFFDVKISKKEMENIKYLFKEIEKIIPEESVNDPFVLNGLHHWIIKKRDDGLCVFGYLDKAGTLRCAIETICREQKMPVFQYKPCSCIIWPFSIYRIGREFFLTVACPENSKVLGYGEATTNFKCLTQPLSTDPPIYLSLERVITFMFGKEFYIHLKNEINNLRQLTNNNLPATSFTY
jgi:hypothetical protein